MKVLYCTQSLYRPIAQFYDDDSVNGINLGGINYNISISQSIQKYEIVKLKRFKEKISNENTRFKLDDDDTQCDSFVV